MIGGENMIKLKKSNERKFLSGIFILVLVVGLVVLSTIVKGEVAWFQGFEADTNGWNDHALGGTILRVASGDSSVISAGGDFHAKLTLGPVITGGSFAGKRHGPYTEWGGTNNTTFPENGYMTEVDVYLDMTEADGQEKIFDFSSSVLEPGGDPDDTTKSFVFTIGTVAGDAPTNQWKATAGTALPGNLEAGSQVLLTETGWYTLRHTFANDGSNVLTVDMELLNSASEIKGSWVYTNPGLVIGTNVAGNGWGWFATNDFADLPVDNVQKIVGDTISPSPVPDPSTEPSVEPSVEPSAEPSVVPSPTISPSPSPASQGPKSRDDCKKDGWKKFTNPKFKNQGDCVSYVEANENAKGNRKDNWFWSLFSKNDDCDRGVIGRFLSGWYGRDDDCDDRDDRGDRGDKDDKNNNDRKRDSDDDD